MPAQARDSATRWGEGGRWGTQAAFGVGHMIVAPIGAPQLLRSWLPVGSPQPMVSPEPSGAATPGFAAAHDVAAGRRSFRDRRSVWGRRSPQDHCRQWSLVGAMGQSWPSSVDFGPILVEAGQCPLNLARH